MPAHIGSRMNPNPETLLRAPVPRSPNDATARKAVHLRSVARAEHYKEFFPEKIIRDFE